MCSIQAMIQVNSQCYLNNQQSIIHYFKTIFVLTIPYAPSMIFSYVASKLEKQLNRSDSLLYQQQLKKLMISLFKVQVQYFFYNIRGGLCWSVRFISVQYAYKKLEKQIQFGSMLPDSFPVFNIELQCDFESSDNVYPAYSSSSKNNTTASQNADYLKEEENLQAFSTIGRRKDNLDRVFWLRLPQLLMVALLDGHCDPQPTEYLQLHLLNRLAAHPQLLSAPESALLQVFADLQGQICGRFDKGCTALVVLAFTQELVVANLGDSQLFGVDGEGQIAPLTAVHNLGNQQQLMQVINRGGIVLKKGEKYRINGELNLSRAFGDRHLKHCMSSKPELYRFPKNAHKRWVMATDGFYNAKQLQRRMNVGQMRELQQDGTVYLDNASVIFLKF